MRADRGVTYLDAQQMKDEILGRAELPDRIRQWRDARIALLRSGKGVNIAPGWNYPAMMMHFVPWSTWSQTHSNAAKAGPPACSELVPVWLRQYGPESQYGRPDDVWPEPAWPRSRAVFASHA